MAVWSRDTRNGKTLAVVVAIDKTDDLAKAGFLGDPDFTPSDRQANLRPIQHSLRCSVCSADYSAVFRGVLLPAHRYIHCTTCCAVSQSAALALRRL